MSATLVGTSGLILLFVLIALRVPIAISLIGVSLGGITLAFNLKVALGVLSAVPYTFAASWTLSSVPMFLFMGFLAYHTGLTQGLFRAARTWVGTLPGGVAIASVLGAGGFSAVTGSSIACAAAMGRIAIPEMRKSGYEDSIATGTLAAAGTIGALIPPSIVLILFGIQAQVSILKLFLFGFYVGVATLALYSLVIVGLAILRPELLPRGAPVPLRERMRALVDVWPLLLVVVGIFGGLVAGWFTTTEAGAVGTLLTAIIGLMRRQLSYDAFKSSVMDTLLGGGSLFLVAIGANVFTRFVALTGLTGAMNDWIQAVAPTAFGLLVIIVVFYLIVGMFLEPVGAMLLTLPLLLPIVKSAGIDIIWFGVLVAKLLEMGMITPPVGLNVFVIQSVSDRVPLEKIFRGVLWFLCADLLLVAGMILLR